MKEYFGTHPHSSIVLAEGKKLKGGNQPPYSGEKDKKG